MHIKKLRLHGFKSYKDTEVELCSGTNIVVGRNGSGKSNFFDAIRFVLGESHDPRASSRTSLLHDGDGGEQIVSAYVEIVLDNSDERLPVDTEDVVLRRQVGAKKDEYFVNSKKSQKAEIQSLLETAGFSKSNPYYIVAQGKIQDMSNLSEGDRIALLKEVAGTHVYEEKRRETMANLQESQEKREQITAMMKSLEERLDSLVGEAKELDEYVRLERRRKALEYTLNSGEVARAAMELKGLEEDMAAASAAAAAAAAAGEEEGEGEGEEGEGGGKADTTASIKVRAGKVGDEVSSVEKELGVARAGLVAAGKERGEAEGVLPGLTATRVKAAERVSVLKGRVEQEAGEMKAAEAALAKVLGEVAGVRKELDSVVIPAAAKAEEALEAARAAVTALKQRQDALHDKAGRSSRFKSRAERDEYLNGLVEKNGGEIKVAEKRRVEAEREEKGCEGSARGALGEAERLEGAAGGKVGELAGLNAQLEAAIGKRKACASAAFEAKRQADECERRAGEYQGAVEVSERNLYGGIPTGLRRGLESVKRLMDPSSPDHIPGIVGPVYDLFRLTNERYNTAIEVVAGNDLFNVVVKTEKVAAAVIQYLLTHNAGRVTLVPLNRVRDESKHANMPAAGPDCVPFLGLLTMDKESEPALRSIFGFALLCKNTEVAAGYARSHGVTAVTLEGDKAEGKKGSLSGGYIDTNASRLKNLGESNTLKAKLAGVASEKAKAEGVAKGADAEALAAVLAIGELEEGIRRRRDDASRLQGEAERRRAEAHTAGRRAEEYRRVAAAARGMVEELRGVERSLKEELATELNSKLSGAETAELGSLSEQLAGKSRALAAAQGAFESARSRRTELEANLDNNLLRRVTELRSLLARGSSGSGGGGGGGGGGGDKSKGAKGSQLPTADELRQALETLEAVVRKEEEAKRVLDEAKGKEVEGSSLVAALVAKLEEKRAESNALNERLNEERLREEKYLEKKRMLQKRKEDAQNKLREIGTLPNAELEELAPLKRKALITGLGETNERLKGLSHINKAAAEQLSNYKEQHEQLKGRMNELEKSQEAIEDLIDTLDQQKDEAIIRTFKGVTASFREVFKELVPKGSATMTLLSAEEGGGEEEEGEGEEEGSGSGSGSGSGAGGKRGSKGGRRSSAAAAAAAAGLERLSKVDRYKGVSISVSFTDGKESSNIAGLSGGQRTLVALSLIFAIQRADPAPFYVFDEIDSALDPIHRAAVGALIKKQSGVGKEGGGAQFILSTFHPEILAYGDEFFGVVIQNKTSSVDGMKKVDAVTFVHKILAEEKSKENSGPPAGSKKARAAAGENA